jgi:hypothetical protein
MDGRDDRVIPGYDKSKVDYYVTLAMLHGAKEHQIKLMNGTYVSFFGRPTGVARHPYSLSPDRGRAAFHYCRVFGLLNEVTNDTP